MFYDSCSPTFFVKHITITRKDDGTYRLNFKPLKMDADYSVDIFAIEVGMQNSGLATSLAATHFAMFPMATVPGAIFSVWHNFSGSIAAQVFR